MRQLLDYLEDPHAIEREEHVAGLWVLIFGRPVLQCAVRLDDRPALIEMLASTARSVQSDFRVRQEDGATILLDVRSGSDMYRIEVMSGREAARVMRDEEATMAAIMEVEDLSTLTEILPGGTTWGVS